MRKIFIMMFGLLFVASTTFASPSVKGDMVTMNKVDSQVLFDMSKNNIDVVVLKSDEMMHTNARYYVSDNIRINANYGVHGIMVAEDSSEDETKLLHGINIGADYIWENGISLGLVYRATSNEDDIVDEWRNKGYVVEEKGWSGDIGLSLGYRF